MRKAIMGLCLGAFGVAFSATVAAAAPVSVIPPKDAVALAATTVKYGPPPGKECIKWTRRFSSSHGFGHRRCVHWK